MISPWTILSIYFGLAIFTFLYTGFAMGITAVRYVEKGLWARDIAWSDFDTGFLLVMSIFAPIGIIVGTIFWLILFFQKIYGITNFNKLRGSMNDGFSRFFMRDGYKKVPLDDEYFDRN